MVAYGPWHAASGYRSGSGRWYWRVCRSEIENPARFQTLEDKRGNPILFVSRSGAQLRANTLNREAGLHAAAPNSDSVAGEAYRIFQYRLAEFDRLVGEVSKLRAGPMLRPNPSYGDAGSIVYACDRLREILAHYGVDAGD